MLIAIDGIDGAGKSSVVKKLRVMLEEEGRECIITKPLGGDEVSSKIRNILLTPEEPIEKDAAPCLFIGDMVHISKSVILPALAEGKMVITDRYIPSTWVYQIETADELTIPQKQLLIEAISRWVPVPDFTAIIDVTVQEAMRRLSSRESEYDVPDVYEAAEVTDWTRRRLAYLEYEICTLGKKGEVEVFPSDGVSNEEIAKNIKRRL